MIEISKQTAVTMLHHKLTEDHRYIAGALLAFTNLSGKHQNTDIVQLVEDFLHGIADDYSDLALQEIEGKAEETEHFEQRWNDEEVDDVSTSHDEKTVESAISVFRRKFRLLFQDAVPDLLQDLGGKDSYVDEENLLQAMLVNRHFKDHSFRAVVDRLLEGSGFEGILQTSLNL